MSLGVGSISRRSFLSYLTLTPLVIASKAAGVLSNRDGSTTTGQIDALDSVTRNIECSFGTVLIANSLEEFEALSGEKQGIEMTSSGVLPPWPGKGEILVERANAPYPTLESAVSALYNSFLLFRRTNTGRTLIWRIKPDLSFFDDLHDFDGVIKHGGYSCYMRFAILP